MTTPHLDITVRGRPLAVRRRDPLGALLFALLNLGLALVLWKGMRPT